MFGATQVASGQRGNPVVEFEGQSIDEMIGAYMKQHDVPGVTLAIVQAPYISRVVGYGTSHVETRRLASPKTVWNVGQLTQAFTAVAIMQLVEAGTLSVDDAVGTHVPNLPAAWQAITLRQLMAHTSGLPDYAAQPTFQPSHEYTPEEVIASVKDAPLEFKPGTQVADSATDFFLLGLVIEHASGMSYEAFITKNQIERLGLRNTLFASGRVNVQQEAVEGNNNRHGKFLSDRLFVDPAEVATGYAERDGRLMLVQPNSQGAWSANGAILASAEDISLWDIGLAGSMLLRKKESRDFIYRGVTLSDGTVVPAHGGWRFPAHKGLMYIQGNVPGFSCYLSRFTDASELLCVTICANKDGLDLSELARRIAAAFDRRLGPPSAPSGMRCLESCYPVEGTIERLAAFLESKAIEVVARVDHAAAAKKRGLDLRPTVALVFGNPAVGTHLMLSKPSVAIDLPLRVVVWQEADGSTWVGYHDLEELARQHGITDRAETIQAMSASLTAALAHATAPY